MKNPIVSIITPSYNQAEFIEETIRSVVNQRYANIQYLVVDGGSSDGSVEIIQKYMNRIHYFVSEKDSGQSAAINKGIKNSTGDIVCWLNSDDLLAEGAVNSVVEFFSENPDAKFLYGDGDIFYHGKNKKPIRYRPGHFDKHELFRKDPLQQPSAFWRRDLHDEIGYIDESLHYTMDWDFFARVALKYEMYYLPQTLSKYRIHEAHKTGSGASQRSDEILEFINKYSDPRHIKTFRRLYPHVNQIRHLRSRYGWRAGKIMFQLMHPLLAISEYSRLGASMDMY